jgi:uncharacterized protein involved in outer membrane biogenesis
VRTGRAWTLELALQTTLLGLAIAIILALLAALVGPLLIDWGGHRSLFEAEASRLIGVEVRVTGAIDARLLPAPLLTLREIEVGGGSDKIHVASLGIEFALGSLMRGVWRASELHVVGPRVAVNLDAAGRVQTPNIAVAFDPDGLSVERLSIENGQVALSDAASGAGLTLERLWFNGEARSLIGPFKGEGAVTVGGALYPYRVTAGRYGDDGTLKLRVNVDPLNHPLNIELDGTLALAGGAPKFDGGFSLARPVGIAARGAAPATQTVSQPWRASGKLKAGAQSVLLEQGEFQYGSEEQGFKLSGVADFKFGKNPRIDGVLSGRQIDLDRALAGGNGSRPLPAAAIRALAEWGLAAFRPEIPVQIGVGIDQLALGGTGVQNVRGDISADAKGWNLDRFEFRAPGFTQVRLSGQLAVGSAGAAFTGPVEIDAVDPKALAAWLEGRGDSGQSDLRPLSLRGEVTLAGDRIAAERLKAEFDRKPIAGRLVYVFATADKSAKLEAELNAPELDIDATHNFASALLAGSTLERPRDMAIAIDIGRATFAGFVARNASARLKVDGTGLQIDRLAVADLGGAAFSANGRIVTAAAAPQGSMRLDLAAPDLTPVIAVLARFAPQAAQQLARAAPMMAPAKLHADLTIDGAAQATQAKLGINGSLGKVRLALKGQADADPVAFSVGHTRLDAKLDTDDGKALVAMLGLDRLVAVNAGPGFASLTASLPLRGDAQIEGWISTAGLDATLKGSARPFADVPAAALNITIDKADIAPLRGPGGGRAALPVALTARVTLADSEVSLADINATVAGSAVRGKLAAGLVRPYRLRGEIDADAIDGAALVGAALGMPAAASRDGNASVVWSSEPFADGAFGDFTGQIAFKARRLNLLPQITAREFRASLRFAKDEFTFDDMTGDVAGGRFAGQASFRAVNNGLQARAKVSVAGADAASLLATGARPPVTGSLGFSAEIAGAGLSPIALIGSLQGTGKISLADGQFAGLDPRAFDAVTRAVDQGLPVDAGRISNVVSRVLDSGQLSLKRVEGTIAVSAGRMQLSNVTADAKDAALSLYGNLDLTDGTLDAHLMLSGLSQVAGGRPDIFLALKGPLAAPARSVDVSALSGWLTLRTIENQAKRIQEIERAQQEIERAKRQPESQPPLPKSEQAPVLPPPVDIRPAPAPGRQSQPAPSVGPQN